MAAITFGQLAQLTTSARALMGALTFPRHPMHLDAQNDMKWLADRFRQMADDPDALRALLRDMQALYVGCCAVDRITFKAE